MSQASLLRLLDLVRRDLGAVDTRLEIGGLDPVDQHLVWCRLGSGNRLVAVFASPPRNVRVLRDRLTTWARSFQGVLDGQPLPRPAPRDVGSRLERELERLVERAGAFAARVVDIQSPVVWARFEPEAPLAGGKTSLDRAVEQSRRTLVRRSRYSTSEPGFAFLARKFAGIYVLVLGFARPYPELRAEAAMKRALSRIERLVLALPPVDPPGRGRALRLVHSPRPR